MSDKPGAAPCDCRLTANNIGDVAWQIEFPAPDAPGGKTSPLGESDAAKLVDGLLNRWHFSFDGWEGKLFLGYRDEEFTGLTLRDVASPDTIAAMRRSILRDIQECGKAVPRQDQPWQRLAEPELEFRAKDGSPRWCEVLAHLMRDAEGELTGLMGVTRDVTERRRAEQALRDSESKLRCLFENLPDFVVVVDRNATIQYVNRGQPGTSADEMRGMCGFEFLIPEHQEACRQAFREATTTGSSQWVEAKDVFGTWWSNRVVPIAGDDGIDHAMIICTDVTQERLAAESLAKEQQLLRQLLDLHERERQLIAYDIHDGFSQQLTGAMFRLEGFRNSLSTDPKNAWEAFDGAMRLLRRAVGETRKLITELRPPILDEMGIVEAVQYLAHEHNKDPGPTIEFEHDLSCERLSPPLESAVFRIVQETLQNACRHSHGNRVVVSLKDDGDLLTIDVRDWGVGFDPEAVATNRFGLTGMRERVRLLGGRMVIESSPNRGTHVSVELPMAPEKP